MLSNGRRERKYRCSVTDDEAIAALDGSRPKVSTGTITSPPTRSSSNSSAPTSPPPTDGCSCAPRGGGSPSDPQVMPPFVVQSIDGGSPLVIESSPLVDLSHSSSAASHSRWVRNASRNRNSGRTPPGRSGGRASGPGGPGIPDDRRCTQRFELLIAQEHKLRTSHRSLPLCNRRRLGRDLCCRVR